jgi:hypothetical protein
MKQAKISNESAIGWISTTDSLMLGFGIMLLLALSSASALESETTQAANDQAAIANAQAAKARVQTLEKQCAALQGELQGLKRTLDGVAKERNRLVTINEGQEQATKEVLGFNGDFRRVAFVIDISQSMTNGLRKKARDASPSSIDQRRWDKTRWEKTKDEILSWAKNLPMEQLHLLFFNSSTQPCPARGLYYDMRDGSRRKAVELIAKKMGEIQPVYQTNTPLALREALDLPGVDTIVLFSDGKPEIKGKSSKDLSLEVLTLARESNNVPINVVGIGDYYSSESGDLGDFLHSISEITGGEFIGR